MPNILNNFTPGVYTPTSVALPIDQVASVFKNWNDRYLQGQEQVDKLNQYMSAIDVANPDKPLRADMENTIRNLTSGEDYAMMAPNIHKAITTLTTDPALKQAAINKQMLDQQQEQIQKEYEGDNLSATSRDYYMNKLNQYQGVGHYQPINPDVIGGPTKYIKGADKYNTYETYKAPLRTKYVDLEKAAQEFMGGYQGGNIVEHMAQNVASSKTKDPNAIDDGRGGLTTSKFINTTTRTHASGDEAASIVSEGLARDPNTSAYINHVIEMKYDALGQPMPTGIDLARERATTIASYSNEAKKKYGKDTLSTQQILNTSYDDGSRKLGKDDINTFAYQTMPGLTGLNAASQPLFKKLLTSDSPEANQLETTSSHGGGLMGDSGVSNYKPKTTAGLALAFRDFWKGLNPTSASGEESERDRYVRLLKSNHLDNILDDKGQPKLNTSQQIKDAIAANTKIDQLYTANSTNQTHQYTPKVLVPTGGPMLKATDDILTGIKNNYQNVKFLDPESGKEITGKDLVNPTFNPLGYADASSDYIKHTGDNGYVGLLVNTKTGVGTTHNDKVYVARVDPSYVQPGGPLYPMVVNNRYAELMKNDALKSVRGDELPLYDKSGKVYKIVKPAMVKVSPTTMRLVDESTNSPLSEPVPISGVGIDEANEMYAKNVMKFHNEHINK